jgi:hypothetical protein
MPPIAMNARRPKRAPRGGIITVEKGIADFHSLGANQPDHARFSRAVFPDTTFYQIVWFGVPDGLVFVGRGIATRVQEILREQGNGIIKKTTG